MHKPVNNDGGLFGVPHFRRMLVMLAGVSCLWLSAAHAQLSIEITGAGMQRIPIAVAPFAGEAALAGGITGIVRADLERSGLFRGLEVPPMSPPLTEAASV